MSTAASQSEPASTSNPPLPALEQLPDDPVILKNMIVELLAALRQERHDNESLRQRLDLLLRRLYGPRGERFDANQPLLFAELADGQDVAAPAAPAPAEESPRRCRPHGRRRLPHNLPHEPCHHELSPNERVCPDCGQTRIDIGTDKSEQLEYRPASLIVIEHFVHKYACPGCSKETQAPAPELAAVSEPAPVPEPAAVTEAAVTEPARESLPSCAKLPAPTQTTPAAQAPEPLPARTEASSPTPPAAPATAQPPKPLLPGVVVAAPRPESPIPKGLPGPGLLAHLIVSKYVDHLPLYRLERVYERQGVLLPRSTTCDWLAASAQLLRPLYERMIALVLQSRVMHTDDTPVKIHDPPPGTTATGRMWTYLGDAAHPYNVFDFTPNHKRDGPQRFLANFQGYLQADAFSGYDALYLPNPRDGLARIVEVACNAHARRKFYEARTSDALRSHLALAYYGQLYEIERQATNLGLDDEQRRQMRQDLAVPILDKFHTWLQAQRIEVLPKSPLAEAIGYALNNWTALVRYTEHGFLAIDNNVAEREMKRIAIGRKNWLFVGSEQGGKTAAVLISFTSTCNRLGIEPWHYLQDILTRLPATPAAQLDDLLPDRWKATRQTQAATPVTTTPAPTSAQSTS